METINLPLRVYIFPLENPLAPKEFGLSIEKSIQSLKSKSL